MDCEVVVQWAPSAFQSRWAWAAPVTSRHGPKFSLEVIIVQGADLTFRGDIGRRRGGRVLGELWAKESHLWCWEDAPPEWGSWMGQARKTVILAPCHPTGFCSLWSWGMNAVLADLALGEGRKNSQIWVPHTCTCRGLYQVQGTFRVSISLQASWGNKQSGLSCSRAERISCKGTL